ncbi:hypothetical protein ACMFMG_003455 [Clarireedia jacksonii]
MLFRTLLFATLSSYAFAAAISERAQASACSSCIVQSNATDGTTTSLSSTSSSASTTSTTATTLTMTATETSGTWAANFQASATAASATCGQFRVPSAATTLALGYLKTNCNKAVIPPGGYCSAASAEAGGINGVTSSNTEGTYAFLCNLGSLPMTAQTLDQDGDPSSIYQDSQSKTLYYSILEQKCPGAPAALSISGQWLYGYVDWASARNIGVDKLCSFPFADVRGYPT